MDGVCPVFNERIIDRPELVERASFGLAHSPVTLILGPRQCGKTTLAQMLGRRQAGSYYDLESPRDLARLTQPQTVLEAARGLVVLAKGKRWGFEIKYQDAPTITKSMRIAMQDLKIERLWVVYPGKTGYPMDENIECVPLAELGRVREALT